MKQDGHVLPLKWRNTKYFPLHSIKQSHPLLLYTGSLTEKLRQSCRHFTVNLISQQRKPISYDEARKLKLRNQHWVTIREVELLCDGKIAVIARTVIPDSTLKSKGHQIKFLGSKPLIDLLAKDRKLKRRNLEISRIPPSKNGLWARRSIFYFYGKPLLVREIFIKQAC